MAEIVPTLVQKGSNPSVMQPPRMAHLKLRSGLRVRQFGARFVFLDLLASRYFLLDGEAAERFASYCDGTATAAACEWLLAQQIVEPGKPEPLHPLQPTVTQSLFDSETPRVRPWLVVEALHEQAKAQFRVRRTSLATLLQSPGAGRTDAEACRPIAAACFAAARYRSAADQCLPNALAMRSMLFRAGLAADLVIGVTMPFQAHCWLQSGDMVLNDSFGSIQNFQPLAIA